MADLFTLFDGSMGAGSAASLSRQTSDSFSEISSENDLVSTLSSGSDSVDLLIDYSDFANFVTFNSAESYVTVTADQILNSYPRDGTADDIQLFIDSLDGYQRYFLSNWPSRTGHLKFSPESASFVRIDDFGVQDGVARTSFVSPGTGSLSIQGWIDVEALSTASSNLVRPVFHKSRPDNSDGCTVFLSGSSLHFRVASGSVSASVSAALTEMPMFFAAVLDRSSNTGSVLMYVGTTGSYPTLQSTASIVLGPRFDLASGSFFFGSGSVPGKTSQTLSGSIDAISVWSTARTLSDMSGTYNRRIHSQSGLIGLWNFNDATPSTPSSYSSIVRDSSGHRLDGRIQLFHSGVLRSGSLVFDSPDPILSLDDPDVVSYVISAQVTGALYDRDNQSLIFNLFPDSFSHDDPVSGEVFKNFALILARHFDRIKAYVNQLENLNRVHYGDFDQAPDELLDIVAKSFGWELGSGFATTDALRYFIGRGVRPGPEGNDGTALSDVKSSFWRRILLNLMYLYKTKGTGESVEALLRSYGVGSNFIRLKEYARKTESRFLLEPVVSNKSAYAFKFMSGSSILTNGDGGQPATLDLGSVDGSFSSPSIIMSYFTTGTVGNSATASFFQALSSSVVDSLLGIDVNYVSETTTLGQFVGFFPTAHFFISDPGIAAITPNAVIADIGDVAGLSFSNGTNGTPFVEGSSEYSFEFRVRFPGVDDDILIATERSGSLVTISSVALSSNPVSLWYEKPSASSTTGNIFVTSSNGRLQLISASLFDEKFYNLAVVKESSTGSLTLYATRYENGELVYSTSSVAFSGTTGFPINSHFDRIELGSSVLVPSSGQFWGQEFRFWNDSLTRNEVLAHAQNYESYGRDVSFDNHNLLVHWRLDEGQAASSSGTIDIVDSTINHVTGSARDIEPNSVPYTKFLFDYAYIPSIDYGWNQKKIRVFDGSKIDPLDGYHDEKSVSLEFNMYDALNEDISHLMTSYDELNNIIGLPVNRYREDYEGLRQMRETYFKRLQGSLNFRVFVDMLDFFDSNFSSIVERLLPARTSFKGDEIIVESHILERPKYQYQLRPIVEGRIEVSGSISIVDRGDDFD